MKRFAGFISLGVAFLGATLVGVVPTLRATSGDSSYSYSRNYVYKISEKRTKNDFSDGTNTNNGNIAYEQNGETPLETVTSIFKERLSEGNITNYKLETLSDNTISLTFKDQQDNYSDIAAYLSYSNSLMMKDYNEKYTLGYTVNELKNNDTSKGNAVFEANSARVEYKDNYPYVVVKLANAEEFKTMINGLTDTTASESSRNGVSFANPIKKAEEEAPAETKLDKEKVVFLLNNWLDGFSVKSLLDDSNKYISDKNFSDYVLTYFDATKPESFFWDYDSSLDAEEQKKQTYEYIYFQNYDKEAINNSTTGVDVTTSNTVYAKKTEDSKSAYQKAILFRNKFNSAFVKYDVTLISENWVQPSQNLVPAFKEYIVRDQRIVFSTIAIATIVAIALVTCFLILNYGVAGIMAGITALGALVSSLFFFNFMQNPFNLGTIIGLFAVAMLSLGLSMLWLHHTKYELYEGKNMKKAFQEANRKSLFNLLDFSIIGAIIGLTCFLIPNSYISSFGGVLVIGALVNALLNGIVFKLIEWFLYNSNYAAKHPRLFGVDKKLIPDLSKDETPKYFEQFKKKAPKHAFKIAGIASLVLLAGSIVGLSTFQAINGNIYNSQSTEINTTAIVELDVQNVSSEYSITQQIVDIESALQTITTDQALKKQALKKANVEVTYHDYNSDEVAVITNREYYFVIDLGTKIDTSVTSAKTYYAKVDNETISGSFDNVFNQVIGSVTNNQARVTLSKSYEVSDDSNNLYVLIAVSISAGITLLYLLLRFGPSKAVAGFAIVAAGLVIVPGIFSLTRIVVPSEITLALLFVETIAFLALDILFTGERQTYVDNKYELKNFEPRKQAYLESTNKDFVFLAIYSAFALFILGSFLLSTSFSYYTILFGVLGLAITLVMLKFLYLPLELFFSEKALAIRDKMSESSKTRKDKKHKKEFDDGPQEAVFPGIND